MLAVEFALSVLNDRSTLVTTVKINLMEKLAYQGCIQAYFVNIRGQTHKTFGWDLNSLEPYTTPFQSEVITPYLAWYSYS